MVIYYIVFVVVMVLNCLGVFSRIVVLKGKCWVYCVEILKIFNLFWIFLLNEWRIGDFDKEWMSMWWWD